MSVVVPAYKVTAFIAETLDSILAQTFRDFEIIVVNDACPDSEELEKVLVPYQDRIRYLRRGANAGPSATRNMGIRAACGELISFLDGDDLYDRNYLDVQLGMLRDHPEADMVYGDALIFGDDPCVGTPVSAFHPSRGPVTVASLLREDVTVLIQSLARREILFRVGLFDEQIRKCEDFDLWLRIAKAGGRIIHHSQAVAKYRVRRDSASADSIDMLRYRMVVLRKLESNDDLSAEERDAIAGARERWAAESHLEQGRMFAKRGEFRAAADSIRKANMYLRRPKLALAAAAMRWMPGLARLAMRARGGAA